MNIIPDSTVYARLSDDKSTIIEYPVLALNIRNRAHPFDWYTRVSFEVKPTTPEFHTLKENLKIVDTVVLASYEIVADTLDQILSNVQRVKQEQTPMGQAVGPVLFSDLDPATVNRIVKLGKDHVQNLMDEFARLKEYDGIGAACSYKDSTVSSFKADSEKCILIRDTAWINLYTYFADITSGEKAVPKSSAEITQVIPAMAW